ncbi:hypothetical protein K227x_04650 [Rubripirellula lacrimiformis]|uniref:Tellurite resistance protein TerB n=1 Tax=Rubripirellula lacrimiformis TaxID=1930273 RepID=A0A517N4N6_9BACT|nr:hypothetical protein [Rubripirellula lacrimiformis]QDT02094.1 hypothetical protein K227x_04650 [Rubripirellula lacrimiformis]
MYEKDVLHRRGQALEDEFFRRVDHKLGEELRAKMDRDEARIQLASATGFQDEELLDHLIDAGFSQASIAALALVPAVFVAWADGNVTPAERQVILHAALRRGVKQEPSAFAMLEDWLHVQPSDLLWSLWTEYSRAVYQSVKPAFAAILQNEILRLATVVAEASGGTFGRGQISPAEKTILDQIAAGLLVDD